MNTKDAFAELILQPKRVMVRSDIHLLRLADATDLWYTSGGAFQATTFGYTGRPSNGQQRSARSTTSAPISLLRRTSVSAATSVTQLAALWAIYSGGNTVHLSFFELNLKF